ncbi:MAG TPA: hypothetical protein VGL26_01695 [Jatrophihabitans sp.]
MTGRFVRRCATVLAVCLVAVAVPIVTAAAAEASPAMKSQAKTELTQHIRVSWHGMKKPKTTATAVVPGIGTLTAVCRPDSTMVQLTPANRNAETQMWMAKYEQKGSRSTVAVKTVRLYRYANADDDGHGGTGAKGHEGLNHTFPIENTSSGYMHGVISQRPGRNAAASTAALPPVTSFELSWYWSGFRGKPAQKTCTIDVHLRTELKPSVGLDWHGATDAQSGTTRQFAVAGLGTLTLQCEDDPHGTQAVTLTPSAGHDVWLYAETIFSAGDIQDHVDTEQLPTDPATGAVGPIELPSNGMLRLFYTSGSVKRDLIVSSYYVVNNALHPDLNLCEVAVASF